MAGPVIQMANVGPSGTLNFGSVAQGQSLVLYLQINNPGTTTLTITNATIALTSGNAGDFAITAPGGFPHNVPAASSDDGIYLTFTPTAAFETVEQATLTLACNAVSGPTVFTLQGTCVNAGSLTSGSISGSVSATQNQSTVGSNTNTSSPATFSSQLILSTAVVTVSMTVAGSQTFSGAGQGGAGFSLQYSLTGSAPWTTFFTRGGSGNSSFNTTASFTVPAGSISNLDQISIEAVATATVGTLPLSINVTGTASNIQASALVGGDSWVSITLQDALSGAITFPTAGFGTVTPGSTYTSLTYTATNQSQAAVTITLTPDTSNGYSVTALSGSLTLAPGASVTFKLTLVPIVGGTPDDSVAITVTIGSLFTQYLEAFYTATPITPAFTLTGATEATIVALQTSSSASFMNAFNAALACEDSIAWSRQYYVDQPHLNKALNRLWLLYERFGAFTLTCQASVVNPNSVPVSSDTVTAAAAADGVLQLGVFDVQVTGTCITLSFSLPALGGLLSIVGWLMKLDERGEAIENT